MRGTLGMRVLVVRGRTVNLPPVRGRGKEPLVREDLRVRPSEPGTDESCRLGRTDESCQSAGTDGVLPLSAAWTHETGLPPDTGIPGFWDITVPVSSRTGEDTVHSSTAQYKPEGPVSVSGSYMGTSHFTGRPERPEYG